MTEDKHDSTLPPRAWAVLILAGIFICWIGYNTQVARDRTETVAAETQAYAEQTNDCLKQVLVSLNQRADANRQLDLLVDRRSAVVDRSSEIWTKFITDLAEIPTSLSQTERDRLSKPIVDEFFKSTAQVKADNDKINEDRRSALAARASNPFPDPKCADKLPGE